MAAPTKVRTSIWSGQVLTAGAGNISSAIINLAGTYESHINIRLTNGATGPAIPPQVQVVIGNDAGLTLPTNFGGALIGSTVNNAVVYFSMTIPIGIESVQLIAGSNTGQNVTVDADISSITAIS